MKMLLPVLLAVLTITGCNDSREPLEVSLKAIRTYGWPATVIDPAPDWKPGSYALVARSMDGFSILEEGGPGERRFSADDRRESSNPRWLNREQFVFGPGWNARRAPDGSVTTPSDGLTIVTMKDGRPLSKVQLCDRGSMPKPAGDAHIVAQDGNHIISIDSRGRITEFGEGFDAEPQPDGPGLCWRDSPAFTPDWWTGRTGPGVMHVRWSRGHTDDVAHAVQAAWTRQGGVLATVLNAPAPAGQPWWAGGTSIVHLAGPGAPPTLVRAGARDPAAHPAAELCAWTGEDGGVWIGTLRAGPAGWSERVAVAGSRPRWSHDGMRLTWLETPAAGAQLPAIRVVVLTVR